MIIYCCCSVFIDLLRLADFYGFLMLVDLCLGQILVSLFRIDSK